MEKRQNPTKTALMQQREMVIDSAVNEEQRTVTLSFASEAPVSRWYGNEILQIDENSVDMQRVDNGLCCLLFNHNSNKVIGKVLRTWIEDSKAKAEVKFDEDAESDAIFNKVKNGTLRGVSVGYVVNNWEEVQANSVSTNGKFAGPAYVAVRWSVYEISIVSVPADGDVGVGRSLEENLEGENDMNNPVNPKTNVEPNTNIKEKSENAIREEQERILQINTLGRNFNLEAEEIEKFIRGNNSIHEVEHAILERLKNNNKPSNTTRVQVGMEEREKFREVATDALLLRAGIRVEKPAEGSQNMMGMGLRDYLVICAEKAGDTNARMKDTDMLLRTTMVGTGELPGILSNVANKSLAKSYQLADTTFEAWTAKGNNTDFKEAKRYRLSEAQELVEIKENGEFTASKFTEEEATASVLTFGRSWSLSRQAIINDDLSALSKIPQSYAYAAKYGINKLVYKTLSELTVGETNKGTAGALSVTSLGEARKLLRTQKGVDKTTTLNLRPYALIVPAELETVAQQLLKSTADPEGKNSGVANPFNNTTNTTNNIKLIVDGELDSYSNKAWYVVADPMLAPTIEVTYLNGKDTPTIDSRVSFTNLGMDFRIYMDYGVNVIDKRGVIKNEGK